MRDLYFSIVVLIISAGVVGHVNRVEQRMGRYVGKVQYMTHTDGGEVQSYVIHANFGGRVSPYHVREETYFASRIGDRVYLQGADIWDYSVRLGLWRTLCTFTGIVALVLTYCLLWREATVMFDLYTKENTR